MITGPGNPVVVAGFRLLPRTCDRLVGPLFRLAALTRARLRPTTGNVHRPVPAHERVHGHWPAPRQETPMTQHAGTSS
ncbi:hypothetical protein VA596_15720 [Amycolatopsis sp., V23-08]|uniref:Uncharacterized protein n=1 Tax=Amycolatopsis heterodermiae TaxID=3110235 RepID=A0ABU5R5T1_9PSEU|nr:hypothetical protein [Amycolatopsis sp., V23-08]MEA5360994.1 hypothetical protein [Amycolatopsis sp., V23-08]